jgi:hypothetical protein
MARRSFSLKTKIALAERHGCAPDAGTKVICPCGASGFIYWVGPRTRIKGSRGWPVFQGLDIDHINPLSLGGGDELSNLQLLCPKCNRSKKNRWVG